MQNSERFRRGVLLPLDDQAEDELRRNDIGRDTRVLYVEISTDDVFYRIWETGLFQAINDAVPCLVDDYEEEWIEAAKVRRLKRAILRFAKQLEEREARNFARQLDSLCERALLEQRPLLFVL